MKKAIKGKPKKTVVPENIELDPDAWPKFEKLVKSAAKMGPKPHKEPKT
ncbi:MAG TPA: hypothetical protein VHC39_03445 [Rhizomicrobium sp.]|nr:hypothetical protein [Rhizomicrobium sp.]